MRHDKTRNSKSQMRDICKYFEIDPIAPSDDKNTIFTRVFRIFEHFREFARLHTFSPLIEEYDPSFHLFEGIHDQKGLFYFDVFGVCMRDRFDTFYRREFRYTFFVFFYTSIKVFVPISNSKNRNHRVKWKIRNRRISVAKKEKGMFLSNSCIL